MSIFKRLRISSQVLIFQAFIIIIYLILGGIVIYTFLKQYQRIFSNELFVSFLARSFSNTINQASKGVNQVQALQLYQVTQQYLYTISLVKLLVKGNFTYTQPLERCLEKQYSKQFYELQVCYGIYGNQSKDVNTIKAFAAFQRVILPIVYGPVFDGIFLASLGEDRFYAKFVGEYTPYLNETVVKLIQQSKSTKSYLFFNLDQKYTYQIFQIPGTQIVVGGSNKNSNLLALQLLYSQYIYDVQSYMINFAGQIYLSSAIKDKSKIYYFNNSNITGFNQTQYSVIQQVLSDSNNLSSSTCPNLDEYGLLCLKDINNKEKIIFVTTVYTGLYSIYIFDADLINSLQIQFQQQIEVFFYESVQQILLSICACVIVMSIIQYILIRHFNSQLRLLEQCAHNSYSGQVLAQHINLQKSQQSIQRLQDAFFNLKHLRNSQLNQIPKYLNNTKYTDYPRDLMLQTRFEQQGPTFCIRKSIQKLKDFKQ
ncbi:hypothetical protein pb186bvf_007702 [Paramecium bursaria]